MPNAKSQYSGRKNNNDRIRELIALLGSLSRTGDTVSIGALSTRLGVSQDEAKVMMDIVCQASGEDIGGLLISSNDDETEFTLQFPGTTGRPIRLTPAETIALVHALDVAGIGEDDPLRERLSAAFWSPQVAVDEVRQALGQLSSNKEALLLCAQSQVESREVSFAYKGLRDASPRKRRALVRRIMNKGDAWYVVALDLDLDQERTFRVDRMEGVVLGKATQPQTEERKSEARTVGITISNKLYYRAFDWPNLQVIHEDESLIQGTIAYYGEQSTWLLRRICAGNGCIIVDDKRIMKLARKYARRVLA